MRTSRIVAGVLLGLVLVHGAAPATEPVKSGPQVGDKVPGPFRPLHVTGPDAGKRVCLYCKNGLHPVAVIFAREMSPGLVSLIKKIDIATAANADAQMGSFVVFLNNSEEAQKALKEVAEREGIKQTILTVDDPAGPQNYQIAGDADVTVLLYTHTTVKANHAFRSGELTASAVDAILVDLPKILAEK